ncbi:MAG TPA: SCO family protein [Cytophagaceae bacterium]|nr:SCO family protein [Cytophagaceae bacterium]
MFRIAFLKSRKICWVLFLFLLSCDIENVRLPYYNAPDCSPIFNVSKEEVKEKITHTISDFSFLDQHGNFVTQKNIEHKIHVANFFFTGCGSICPRMMNNMKEIYNEFKEDTNVVLLSYSVTPWQDNVQHLNKYAKDHNIDSGNWHLLTGNKSSIYKLARQSYFAEEEIGYTRDSSNFLHTEHFILVDKNKRIRGVYNGTLKMDMQQLIDDIRVLKKE